MRKFNKNKALNKLNKKHNKINIKITSIVLSTTILIGAIIYFSFAKFESNQTYSLISGTVANSTILISEKIKLLASSGASDLEYDGEKTLGIYGTLDNNLRYVGSNPNNYIYFNCSTTNKDEMNDETCEKWRIIGLFNNIKSSSGFKSSSVKIIRDESLGNYSWDTSDHTIYSGSGINQWGASGTYEGADLMRELNTDYLGNITVGTDGKWYNLSNNAKDENMPASTLNSNAQNMIQEVTWNIGSIENIELSKLNTINVYNYERSNTIGKICRGGSDCNDSVNRTTSWIGKVSLMYLSDYSYATSGGPTTDKKTCLDTSLTDWNLSNVSDCKNNSWLASSSFQWALSPVADMYYAYFVFVIDKDGYIWEADASSNYDVHPTIFLKSTVSITSGEGTSSNPYKLVID